MKKYLFWQLAFVVIIFATASQSAFAQKGKNAPIEERNVRAGMQFLAGDALQGRGSGTLFERIAAEYIGSQFMQFGLEPASDADADGKRSYVQTVSIHRGRFTGNPTIKYDTSTLEHGKGMIVARTTTGTVSGELQKLSAGEEPKAGAAVFVKLKESEDRRKMLDEPLRLVSKGASIVMIEETPQSRALWPSTTTRNVTFSAAAKQWAIVYVSKDAADELSKAANGTKIEFGGPLAPEQKQQTWNAMGKITGTDKTLSSEVILLSSHLDHVGVRENSQGPDKIFNGADDDASGSVAVLELARVLAAGKRPKRTVYFVCFGSEEAGGYGAGYFVNNMPFPKEKLVANLEFEMIGRPDAKVKPEELWLTGYERSNLGPELAKRGAKLVQDPHPEQNFFQRSDNIQLARAGIIAHTVSSFGLHNDYHQASDEVKTIDFVHMTRSITSMVKPIQWLVNSNFVPVWNEGKKP